MVKDLVKKGFEVIVEAGAGLNSYFSDEAFTASVAKIENDKTKIYTDSDIVLIKGTSSIAQNFVLKKH